MRRMSRSFPIAFALLFVSSEASAFCRSSTCRTTATKECPTDENGCPATGEKLWWPTSCISYATNKLGTEIWDPAETRAIIKKTFQAWSDVPCPDGKTASMTFQEREPVSCKKSQYNKTSPNVNVVLFQDSDWKYRGIDGTLAKTSVTYNDETGEIYDADIEINSANNEITITDDPSEIEYDLQAILTHEVGHFIGIAHSDKPDAVMYPTYNPGSTTQRKLTPDDVDAVCHIYPPESGVACETEPRNGFSGSCDDPEPKGICSVATLGTGGADGSSAPAFFGLVLATGLLTAVRVSRRTIRFGRRRS